jgi:hypothetical protein
MGMMNSVSAVSMNGKSYLWVERQDLNELDAVRGPTWPVEFPSKREAVGLSTSRVV